MLNAQLSLIPFPLPRFKVMEGNKFNTPSHLKRLDDPVLMPANNMLFWRPFREEWWWLLIQSNISFHIQPLLSQIEILKTLKWELSSFRLLGNWWNIHFSDYISLFAELHYTWMFSQPEVSSTQPHLIFIINWFDDEIFSIVVMVKFNSHQNIICKNDCE